MHRQPTSSKHIGVESIRNRNGLTSNSGGEMSKFVYVLRQSIEKLIEERQQLIQERDEARREVCEWSSESDKKFTPEEDADLRKWDCFK